MCSIAGGPRVEGVWAMLNRMGHRAPDGMNVIETSDFSMGMGRLAILDPENTNFPFTDGRYVLSFNGEIYNYQDLSIELAERGHRFFTHTDTEILFAALKEWGVDALDKLNGMFALAFYDTEKKNIFFARDIAGEKPFYYSVSRGFGFASESKALQHPIELPHAHCGTYDLMKNELKIWKWWNFEPKEIEISDEAAEEHLEMLLADSIRLRTQDSVHKALYLSDGIDSNLIKTFAPHLSTLTYIDKLHDKEEFLEKFPKAFWHLDAPLDSFSVFALWTLAEDAKKEGVKVVISGEGADELFGGYVRYVPYGMNLAARDTYPSYKTMFPLDEEPGWKDFNGKMQGLLRMGDRMAAAHGLENRCPFLDRRIIEFAFSLPRHLRVYGLDTKVILKRILKKRNPHFQEREKEGLYASVNEWLGASDKYSKGLYMAYQQKLWRGQA